MVFWFRSKWRNGWRLYLFLRYSRVLWRDLRRYDRLMVLECDLAISKIVRGYAIAEIDYLLAGGWKP